MTRAYFPLCDRFVLEACSVGDESLSIDPRFVCHAEFTAKLFANHLADEQCEPVVAPALGIEILIIRVRFAANIEHTFRLKL